jgi:hypothetical protein
VDFQALRVRGDWAGGEAGDHFCDPPDLLGAGVVYRAELLRIRVMSSTAVPGPISPS